MDGAVLKVHAKKIPKGGEDLGFEGGEEVDDSVEMVINVVDSHELNFLDMKMTTKLFKGFVKDFYKKIKVMDGVDKKRAQKGIAGLMGLFAEKGSIKEYDFYTTDGDFACDGSIIICGFEGGVDPVFYFLLDGMVAEKY